ncbi:MAG: hypothetical protein DCF30_21130 [Hyphomicrobiales bacterium]|nr:MAG: hypothetical protein DCF30_21130 [Hyphomicrobiales bacterium]
MPQEIFQLVYKSKYSFARVDSTLKTLRDIVLKSKKNNVACNVTGDLIFDGEVFIQILEGDPADVRRTYNKINEDRRHKESEILLTRIAGARDFPAWAMGGFLQTAPISNTITGIEAIDLAKKLMTLTKTL